MQRPEFAAVPATSLNVVGSSRRRRESNEPSFVSYPGEIDKPQQIETAEGASSDTERHRPSNSPSDAATLPISDPIASALEAALALHQSGAGPKALRRALRQIEELIDE